VRALPVVEGGRLEGMVTQRDIMRITSTRSNIPVGGVMQPVRLLLTPSSDLSRTARELADFGFDEVPVVQSPTDRVVVGVLRMEDVLRRLLDSLDPSLKVERVMRREVVTCEADQELSSVWDLMEREELSGIPVVQRERGLTKVVGMVTRSDIVSSGKVRMAEESRKGRRPPRVKSVMRSPAITISPDASLSRAVELMLAKRVKRLPVVQGGQLVGIVSRSDVVNALCK
jgi:CBS domain-containing protein